MNKSIEPGVAMNALAHATLGLGASVGAETLRLDTYRDKNGNDYPNISQMPFIILSANSNKIKETVLKARDENIAFSAFINTMTGGTYLEQIDNTSRTDLENLAFYGVVLFGAKDKVTEMTKKFSLWK